MTQGGVERLNFIIGLQFQPGDAVQEALRTGSSVHQVVQRVLSQPLNLGTIANPDAMLRQAEQIGRQLRQLMESDQTGRVNAAGAASGVLGRDAQLALGGVLSTGNTTAGSAERARLAAEGLREVKLNNERLVREGKLTEDLAKAEGEKLDISIRELQQFARTESSRRAVERSNESQAAATARGTALIERAQAQAAETARAQGLVAGERPTFPGAQAGSLSGAAQAKVNALEQKLATATDALAQLRLKIAAGGDVTYRELSNSEAAVRNANNNLAAARREEAIASTKAQGSFRSQFALGFKGETDRPYGEQLGQAFKFSLFYGTAYRLLGAFTTTLSQTLQEGIQFQQAMTELKIAAGDSAANLHDIARSTGDSAVQAGFAPSQGVLLGARSLGLYGATGAQGASPAPQPRIAAISARVASQMALGSGQDPAALQTQIAAITAAFGTGASGQLRVQDLDAYFAHVFGIPTGGTVQAVSESGTVGKAAGFSQEEVTAIAADLIARTGQTPAAVAGFMAQIFSRGGEGSLTALTGKYGIDQTADLATQIKELARVYASASDTQRAEISAGFGRGKVQNAAIALLQDFGNVTNAAEGARTDATGAGQKAFDLRMGNLGGQIAATIGELKAFASELGQSGVLDVVGVALTAFRELVQGGTELLRLWNQMSRTTRDAIIAIGLLAVAARTTAISQGISNIAAGAPLAALTAGSTARGAGLLAGGGAAVAGGATAVAGAVLVDIELAKASKEFAAAQREATAALKETASLDEGSSSEQVRAQAASVAAARSRNEEAAGGFFSRFNNVGSRLFGGDSSKDQALATADRLDREVDRLNAAADYLEQKEKSDTGGPRSAILGLDTDSITAGLQQVTQSGGNTRDQLRALSAALRDAAGAASETKDAFDPKTFSIGNAGGIMDALNQGIFLGTSGGIDEPFKDFWSNISAIGSPTGPRYAPGQENAAPGLFARAGLDNTEIQRRLEESFKSRGIASMDDLKGRNLKDVASDVVDLSAADLGLGPEATEDARQQMMKIIRQYFRNKRKALEEGLIEDRKLTVEETAEFTGRFLDLGQQRTAELPESDLKGRIASSKRVIRRIASTIRDGSGNNRSADDLAEAERDLAQAQFDRLEALRRIAQRNARSVADVARQGRRFLGREIRGAVKGGDTDLLVKILGQAGNGAIRIALNTINEALAVAQTGVEVHHRIIDEFGRIIQVTQAIDGIDAALVAELKKMKRAANEALSGGHQGNLYRTGSDANLPDRLVPDETDDAGSGETAADRRVAAAQAAAVRSESPIQQARADILAARVAMSQAKKGTVEYYDALAQYYSARNELTDAILDYRHNLDLLSIDMTDPVAMAAAAVREAARKLRSDRGKGKDVIAADKVALEQAQNEQEATAFQTRLDTVQTAEALGRISHQAYIRYLENESRRLNRIKDRTFQQQQELNQIDQLLKDAAGEMDAQFNLGSIKLPTVYQVRRAIEERGPRGGANPYDTGGVTPVTDRSTTHITVHGADAKWVLDMIDRAADKPGRTITASPRRRI